MYLESSLDISDSIEDRKLINRLFSTEVEFNVKGLYKSETYCTELNEASSNTEGGLDGFELADCPNQGAVQITEFNMEGKLALSSQRIEKLPQIILDTQDFSNIMTLICLQC